MNTKELLKMVFNRYTSIGLTCMGIYNVVLLFLYFKHRIEVMPDNVVLIVTDVCLVAGITLLGFIIEFFRRLRHKGGSRADGSK